MKLLDRAAIVCRDAEAVAASRRRWNETKQDCQSPLDPTYFQEVAAAAERIIDGSEDHDDLKAVLNYSLVEALSSPNEEEPACRAHLAALATWRKNRNSKAAQDRVLATRMALRSVLSMGSSFDRAEREAFPALCEAMAKAEK